MFDSPDTTRQSSAQAFATQSNARLKGLQDAVLNILIVARARGVDDMSCTEICRAHEANVGRRVDPCSLTGPINRLESSKLIERAPRRQCSVTKMNILPVRVVLKAVNEH